MKIIGVLLALALLGCSDRQKPASGPVAVVAKEEPPDCYHQAAPKLAELEAKYGPIRIDPSPEYAAKRDDPEYLWFVISERKIPDSMEWHCAGFGPTLGIAVSRALLKCGQPPQRKVSDLEKDETARNLPKYQAMIDGQMCAPEKKK